MKKIVFFIVMFCYITIVNAAVDCNKMIEVSNKCSTASGTLSTLKPGNVITCEVSFKSLESKECTPTVEKIKSIVFNLNYSNDFVVSNQITGLGFSKISHENSFNFKRDFGISESSVYKYDLTMPNVNEDKTYSISISNVAVFNDEDLSLGYNIVENPVSIKVLNPKSSINTLSKLNVSSFNLTPRFSSDVLNYSLSVDTNVTKVNIDVEATDNKALVTGDIGEKNLNFGNNEFKINVKSETNVTKTYTVIVNRNDKRSDENGLSSLIISNSYIDFKPDKLRYDIEVEKEVSSVKISSTLIDSKSSYVEGFENGTKNLVIGINTFYIKIKAENESIKTYTIVIVKNDGKSSVNTLSSLRVINQSNLDFVPESLTYNINVSSVIKEVEIDSNLMSTKSSYVEGFGNRKVELKIGLNKIYVKVKSEKGEIKTYTINITREDPKDNLNLKELSIENVTLDFNNKKNEYEFEVSYTTEKLKIKAITEEEKTIVNIIGNESLIVGKNIVKIELTSESGKKKELNLIVMKREKASNVSKLKNIIIKDHSIDFDSDILEYEIKLNNEKSVEINIEKIDPLSIYSIIGNDNLKPGSKIVINSYAEDGTLTAYTIKISNDNEFIIPLIGLTGLIFVISITAAKKKKNINIIKKDNINKPNEKSKEKNKIVEPIQKSKEIKKNITPGIPEIDHPTIPEESETLFDEDDDDFEDDEYINNGIPEIVSKEEKKEDEILDI